MKVQPVSQVSFKSFVFSKEARTVINKRSNKADIAAIDELVKMRANSSVKISVTTNGAGLLSGEICNENPKLNLSCAESIFSKNLSPLDFIKDVCKCADSVNAARYDAENYAYDIFI